MRCGRKDVRGGGAEGRRRGRGQDSHLNLPPSPLVPTDDNTQTERGEKPNAHLLSSRCGP